MSGFGFALAIILSVVGFVSPPFLMQFLSLWLSMPSLLQVLPYTEQCCLVFCTQETITKLSTSSNISNGSSLTPQTASKKALLDFKIAWVHLCLLSSLQLIEVHYLLLHSSIFAFSLLHFSGSWISTNFQKVFQH